MVTLRRRNPLLILKNSGGAARAIALFVELCLQKKSVDKEFVTKLEDEDLQEMVQKLVSMGADGMGGGMGEDGGITAAEAKVFTTRSDDNKEMMARELAEFAVAEPPPIHIFPNAQQPKESFDMAILRAPRHFPRTANMSAAHVRGGVVGGQAPSWRRTRTRWTRRTTSTCACTARRSSSRRSRASHGCT